MRRALAAGGVVLVLLGMVGTATAQAPGGPRLGITKWWPGGYSVSLMTIDPSGQDRQTLVRGSRREYPVPLPFDGPVWLPDGSAIAFTGLTGHLYDEGSKIFVVSADGGAPWPIPGTEGGFSPAMSADGQALAFARRRERCRTDRPSPGVFRERCDHAVSTWMVNLGGDLPRRVTPSRFGLEYFPSSFSPDGTVLALTRISDRRRAAVVALRLDGSGMYLLARNATGAEFSPDGSRIGYMGSGHTYRERDDDGGVTTSQTSDVFVKRLNGSGVTRLTNTPKKVEVGPSWDPSGERLAFVQFGRPSSLFETGGVGNALVQVNADGSCKQRVLSLPRAAIYGAVWQPGPGREAGRIAC